ncbi:MAG: hypothetical protein U9O86_05870 [Campylobacterota bacterium]|nr:hypothetical protein [Campylobacterota bacterium]
MKTLLKYFILIPLLIFFNSCGGGGGDSTQTTTPITVSYNSNSDDIALFDESVALETQAYNDLVLLLSDNATKRLFDIGDINDSQYETLIQIVNNLDTANSGYLKIATSLESKLTLDSPIQSGIVTSQKAPSLDLGLGELIGKVSVNGVQHFHSNQSDLIGKIIFKIKANQCASADDINTCKVAFNNAIYSSAKDWANLHSYEVPANSALFLEKLNNGNLENTMSLHNYLLLDISDYGDFCNLNGCGKNDLTFKIAVDVINKGATAAAAVTKTVIYSSAGPVGAVLEKLDNTVGDLALIYDTAKHFFVSKTKKVEFKNSMKNMIGDRDQSYSKINAILDKNLTTDDIDNISNNMTNNFSGLVKRSLIRKKVQNNNNDPQAVIDDIEADEFIDNDIDWGIGGLIQSVSNEALNEGRMLLSWYDDLTQQYKFQYNPSTNVDEDIIIVPADKNISLMLIPDSTDTLSPIVKTQNNLLVSQNSLTATYVDMQDEIIQNELLITAAQTVKVYEEVTLHIDIPQTMYPPFSLSHTGSSSAIFVLSANLSQRSGNFAEFSSATVGSFMYNVTVTDKYYNVKSASITIKVVNDFDPIASSLTITPSSFSVDKNVSKDLRLVIPDSLYPPFTITTTSYNGNDLTVLATTNNRDVLVIFDKTDIAGTYNYSISVSDNYNNTLTTTVAATVIQEATADLTGIYEGYFYQSNSNCGPASSDLHISVYPNDVVEVVVSVDGAQYTGYGTINDNNIQTDGTDYVTWSGSITGIRASGTYVDDEGCNGTFIADKTQDF